jgi:DUF971 family protein
MKPKMRPWPREVRLEKDKSVVRAAFDTGETFELGAEYLRVHSPSAEVKGHGASKRPRAVSGKRYVKIADMKPIGNYAVRLVFDDGHDTGLYSWDYLYELGRDEKRLWTEYLRRIEDEGSSRDPEMGTI